MSSIPLKIRNLLILVILLSATCVQAINHSVNSQDKHPDATEQTEAGSNALNPKMSDKEFALRLIHLTREELAELAKSWLNLTQQQVKEAADINIALLSAKGPTTEQLRVELEQSLRRRALLLGKFSLLAEEWKAKGAKPNDVTVYRDYVAAVTRKELQISDPKTLGKLFIEWLTSEDGGVRLGIRLASLIAALLLVIVLAWTATGLVRHALSKVSRISKLLRDFLSNVAFWLILAVGFVIVLSLFGINMTPLLAFFGGASFIIGFATQSTLSNLASGLLLMITKPFDVGDRVDVAGVSGTVQKVSIVSTTILSPQGETIIVPNKQLWDSVIINKESGEPQLDT